MFFSPLTPGGCVSGSRASTSSRNRTALTILCRLWTGSRPVRPWESSAVTRWALKFIRVSLINVKSFRVKNVGLKILAQLISLPDFNIEINRGITFKMKLKHYTYCFLYCCCIHSFRFLFELYSTFQTR